jgi:hypothetical protein
MAARVSQNVFRKPPAILKIVSKAGYECIREKIDQWERRKAGTEIWWLFGAIFKEASINFGSIFLLNKQDRRNIEKP